ncbi:hypothetical protein EP7_002497 [Isosphaeraceae bacterium EP7]
MAWLGGLSRGVEQEGPHQEHIAGPGPAGELGADGLDVPDLL